MFSSVKEIKFTKSFSDPKFGNIYIGKVAKIPVREANQFINFGKAVEVQAPQKKRSTKRGDE